jgi:lipid-binding SYLF domain-containing protein
VKTPFRLLLLMSFAVWSFSARAVVAGGRESATVEASAEVVDALAAIPLRGIPPALFKEAQGVAIFPGVLKAGFLVGGRFGRGVILVREKDGSWGPPTFVRIRGGSFGFQAGAQATDLVLLFKTKDSVDRILKGKRRFTLGADAAVAAGPIGRQAEAATDAQLRAEIYSYSRSRGLFGGLALEGAVLSVDSDATADYNRGLQATVIDRKTGKPVPMTPPDAKLREKLATLSAKGASTTTSEPPLAPKQPRSVGEPK